MKTKRAVPRESHALEQRAFAPAKAPESPLTWVLLPSLPLSALGLLAWGIRQDVLQAGSVLDHPYFAEWVGLGLLVALASLLAGRSAPRTKEGPRLEIPASPSWSSLPPAKALS